MAHLSRQGLEHLQGATPPPPDSWEKSWHFHCGVCHLGAIHARQWPYWTSTLPVKLFIILRVRVCNLPFFTRQERWQMWSHILTSVWPLWPVPVFVCLVPVGGMFQDCLDCFFALCATRVKDCQATKLSWNRENDKVWWMCHFHVVPMTCLDTLSWQRFLKHADSRSPTLQVYLQQVYH